MAEHAAASPSSASMWMACPASITMTKGRTRPSSRYAMEGTVAHMLAEMILGGEIFPPARVTIEGREFLTATMFPDLHSYVDHCRGIIETAEEWYCEQRVEVGGVDLVWGTADFIAKTGRILDIVDLKFGKGVEVDPDTAQLKIYAVAAWDTFWPGFEFEYINLTVVQPRIDPKPKPHFMRADKLVEWTTERLLPAMDRIVADDISEKAGSWCRWCVRKSECSAFSTHKSSLAAEIFDDGVDH